MVKRKSFNKLELESLAESLKDQHNNLSINVSYYFLRTWGIFNRYLDIGFRKVGLNRTQVMILSLLLVNGGTMTPSTLKSSIFRSNNAISKSLDSLDRLGLTKSSGSKKDRRQRKVTLTEDGLKLIERILPIRHDLFANATSCLSQKDGKLLLSILDQLRNHIHSIMGSKPRPKQEQLYF